MRPAKCILIADDEADDVFFLSRALQRVGCNLKIVSARDGVELVHTLAQNTPAQLAPACLILDLHMPGRDGFQVLEWIKKSAVWCGLPVVVLTSSDFLLDRQKALSLGAREFLVKPLSSDDLFAAARHIQQLFCPVTPPMKS